MLRPPSDGLPANGSRLRRVAAVAVSLPAPYEASDGRVEGRAQGGTTDIGVYVSGGGRYRLVTMRHLQHAGRFSVAATGLPAGDRSLRIVAFRDGKVLGSRVIRPVYGLPRRAFRVVAARRTVAGVQRRLKGIGGAGVRAVWMRGLASGDAASYNAGTAVTLTAKAASGSTFSAYESADGVTWTLVGTDTIAMGTTVYVGLAVTSHTASSSAACSFDSVNVQ